MRSGIYQSLAVLMAAASLGDQVDASAYSKHPFVGEHANASAVHHDNGTISQRMTAKPTTHDKHSSIISDGEGLFEQQEQTW